MSKSLVRVLGIGPALVLLCGCGESNVPPKEATHAFKVSTVMKMEVEFANKEGKGVVNTEVVYRWHRAGNERTLTLDSSRNKEIYDGKERVSGFLSREKVVNTRDGVTDEFSFEEAPDKWKQLLQECFDVPVCKLEVDENGTEVKRTILAPPSAERYLNNGLLTNAMLFHAPFFANKDEWEGDVEMVLSDDVNIKGKLTYKKLSAGKSGQAVAVSGTLTKETFKSPDLPLGGKKIRYVITGEQIYDPAQKEWVSGKLSADVSMRALSEDKVVGLVEGTMVMTLEKLPAKK